MQLHVFELSGNYSAPQFDVLREPAHFILALAGCVLMDDDELGHYQGEAMRTSSH